MAATAATPDWAAPRVPVAAAESQEWRGPVVPVASGATAELVTQV
nr:hypothetical protein [Mycobacterium kubicae]